MGRRRYIDWARGLAVLIMIQAHALDAWTRAADRTSIPFRDLMILGGFAAPLFLWLAGAATVLSAEAVARKTGSRRTAATFVSRRGLEIFILAFLFRLQAFVVSPGNPLIAIFKVDILNVMGPALVGAGVAWAMIENRTVGVIIFSAAATLIAMITPVMRSAGWVGDLPTWIQWYIRPAGEYTTFTLFPWAGFVAAGAASGLVLATGRREAVAQLLMTAVGALLIGIGFYTASQPTIFASSSFWTSSPTFFAIRVGVMMIALAVLFALERFIPALATVLRPLERFGRNSLFVYWIHVELVYGYATWILRARLHLWQMEFAFVVFTGLMFSAIGLRARLADAWRSRREPRPLTAGPTAAAV
jgi:uncharacterized membrane protein